MDASFDNVAWQEVADQQWEATVLVPSEGESAGFAAAEADPTPVPEPVGAVLLLAGMAAMAVLRWRFG